MRRTQGPLVALTSSLVLLASACGGTGSSGAGNDGAGGESLKGTTLRVGSSSIPDVTDVTRIRAWQNLEKRGIDVKISHFEGDQPVIRALQAGGLDIATSSLGSLILAVGEADAPLKSIAITNKQTDYALLAQPDITKLSDLSGKKFGISSPGAYSDVLSRTLLRREGVGVSKVNFTAVGGTSARLSALRAGTIAAGPAHIYTAKIGEKEGLNILSLYADTIPSYYQQGITATEDWIEENPKLAQVVVDAVLDATRWSATHKEGYVELAQKEIEDLDPDIARQSYDLFKEIGMFATNGGMSGPGLKNTATLTYQAEQLQGEAPPAGEWVDRRFVDDYLKRKGKK